MYRTISAGRTSFSASVSGISNPMEKKKKLHQFTVSRWNATSLTVTCFFASTKSQACSTLSPEVDVDVDGQPDHLWYLYDHFLTIQSNHNTSLRQEIISILTAFCPSPQATHTTMLFFGVYGKDSGHVNMLKPYQTCANLSQSNYNTQHLTHA